MLAINKNGTKTFSKVRQLAKIGGDATTSVTGHFNTSLDVTTSASAKFAVNITYFTKGHNTKTTADGTVVVSASSKSKIVKRRLFQLATSDYSTTIKIPALNNQILLVNSSVRLGSESLKLPFRSFVTFFKAGANTTINNGIKSKVILAGEVVSRVVFANKTVSLTKSCIKAYVKGKSSPPSVNNDGDGDDSEEKLTDSAGNQEITGNEDEESARIYQISSIKAKRHTWTKVVSQSKTQVVVDIISCTKTRTYGKNVQKGISVVFVGSGQVSWEKSQITIDAKRLQNLSPHEYGVQFINKQLESSSLIQLDIWK